MQNKKVLIIENDNDLRDSLETALTNAGFKVYTAENGSIGVDTALAHKPDVILLDIMMPEMTGHEALDKLRDDPWGKNAKVIMLTSLSGAEDIVHAVEKRTEEYIIKSHTSLADIIKKVREAMVR